MNLDYSKVRAFISKLPIKNPDKVIVPFRVRPAQSAFLDLMSQLQERRRLPRVIIVKSRRVGVSSICVALLTVHSLVIENADARITAHLNATAKELFEGGKLMHRQLRSGVEFGGEVIENDAPDPTAQVIRYGAETHASKLTFGTANTVAGGRGMGFSALLATEAAYYEQEGSFTSLFPALPMKNLFFGFLESTANGVEGIGGPFYENYLAATSGDNELAPFFIGPQDDPTCVVDDETARRIMDRPTDPDNEAEEKDLIQRFHLNINQLAWRRITYEGPDCMRQLNKLHTDFPYWWEQAFVSSGEPVFTDQEKRKARESVKNAPSARHVEILALGTGPQRQLKVQNRSDGHITIWQEPEVDHYYYIGADAASGKDEGDFAAAAVYDGTTGTQVAEYEKRAGVHEFADDLDKLGRYYGKYMPLKQAMMNIEISCNLGFTVFQRLRSDFHYSNWYRWRSKDDRMAQRVASKFPALCWETTSRSREMLMNHYRIGLMQDEVYPRSQTVLSQIERCERKEFGMRWDVRRGHDDVLMAHFITWIMIVQWPPPNLLTSSVGGRVMEPRDEVRGTPTLVDTALNLSPILEAHRQKVMQPKRKNPREEWQKAREKDRVFV